MSDLLTLSQAAELSGYSREALKQRVRRGRLSGVKGNDGLVRVRREDIQGLPPAPQSDESEDDTATALASVISQLRDDLATARDDIVTLRDRLEQEREASRVVLGQMSKDLGDMREQAARLEAERDAERRRADEATALVEDLKRPWIVRVIRSFQK